MLDWRRRWGGFDCSHLQRRVLYILERYKVNVESVVTKIFCASNSESPMCASLVATLQSVEAYSDGGALNLVTGSRSMSGLTLMGRF